MGPISRSGVDEPDRKGNNLRSMIAGILSTVLIIVVVAIAVIIGLGVALSRKVFPGRRRGPMDGDGV